MTQLLTCQAPDASTEVEAGSTVRGARVFPTAAGAMPPSATTTRVFVFFGRNLPSNVVDVPVHEPSSDVVYCGDARIFTRSYRGLVFLKKLVMGVYVGCIVPKTCVP